MAEKPPTDTPPRPPKRARLAFVAAPLVLAGIVAWLAWPRAPRTLRPGRKFAEVVAAIERGEAGAVARAREAASQDWPGCREAIQVMLSHERWRVRAAACEILAGRTDSLATSAVLPRASDVDWRVRAAACAALGRIRKLAPAASLRDTPLARREELLLEWLEAHDARSSEPLAAELCELYVADEHVEFGRPMAARCLACHAGADPAPFGTSDRCAACHGQIHSQWASSAHANSLVHLRLRTVHPASRTTEWIDFGPVRGLSCTECHRLARAGPPASRPATQPKACPFTFDPRQLAADSCKRCHAATHNQWLAWRAGRQPRRLAWPPGQIHLDGRGDTRTCTDCHMPQTPAIDGAEQPDHHWAARRDLELLCSGIDVQVAPAREAGNERIARLLLTNLSGHAYPTGTRRRAIRLYAGPAGAENLPLIATLSPVRPGALWTPSQPALAPGEQRSFVLPVPPDTPGIAYRVVYVRNRFQADGYTAQILSAVTPLSP